MLNVDVGYPNKCEDRIWVEGAKKAICKLNAAGYFVFVIANQSGVARGFYTEAAMLEFHDWMSEELANVGGHVDAYYDCSHQPDFGSSPNGRAGACRMPASDLIKKARSEWPVDCTRSFVVGDHVGDLEAARAAGLAAHRFGGGALDDLVDRIIGT